MDPLELCESKGRVKPSALGQKQPSNLTNKKEHNTQLNCAQKKIKKTKQAAKKKGKNQSISWILQLWFGLVCACHFLCCLNTDNS